MTSDCDVNKALPDLVLDIDDDDDTNKSSLQEDTLCSENSLNNLTDSHTAGPSQNVSALNNKQSTSDEQKSVKTDSRTTPRRTQLNSSRGRRRKRMCILSDLELEGDVEVADASHNIDNVTEIAVDTTVWEKLQECGTTGNNKIKQPGTVQGSIRLCEQHTFLTDITEVRQMEQGLLKLLDDFHSGKLQAFGKDCTFEKMEQVREQQEKLARLHFELNAQQEIYGPQSEEGRSVGRENLGKLIENLQQLSRSIEQLQISSPSLQTDV